MGLSQYVKGLSLGCYKVVIGMHNGSHWIVRGLSLFVTVTNKGCL